MHPLHFMSVHSQKSKKTNKTDFSESKCAFSEASAKTVFLVYEIVTEGGDHEHI